MAVDFYSYRCLRSTMFAAQEARRNGSDAVELGFALMGLARDLATPLPPGQLLPTGSVALIEEMPLASLLLAGLGLDALALAGAVAAVYGVILPDDLAAPMDPVVERPGEVPEMERAAAREILAARKSRDNHIDTRHRLLALIVARGHLQSGELLETLGIRRHRDLESYGDDGLDAARAALNEEFYELVSGDPASEAEMHRLFPATRGIVRRRRRARRA